MKKHSIKRNYFYNISYQVFALITPLIITPYISRVLSVEGIGIYSYTYSIVRYFWILSSLGIAACGIILTSASQDNREERSQEFWNLMSLKMILTIIFGLIYILYSLIISKNTLIALIQGIYLISAFFDISWFYQGIEDFKSIMIKNFLIKIVNIIFIFIFIKKESDLNLYIFTLALFQFAGNVLMWLGLKKYINFINIKKWHPLKNLKICMQLFLPTIATQLFSIIDKSMIGWITKSPTENGYYEQSLKIIEMILVLITTLGTVFIPTISREYKNGNKDKIIKVLDNLIEFVFFIGTPLLFGFIIISNTFVPIFFGEEYAKSAEILKVLSTLFVFMGLSNVIGQQYLVSTNQQMIHTKFLIIGGFTNVFLNIIFIHMYKATGAAIGTAIGEMVVVFLEICYLNKTNQYSIINIIKKIWKYILSSIVMSIIVYNILKISNNNIVGIIISIIFGILIYFAVLILLRSRFLLEQIKNFKKNGIKK